MRLNNGLHTSPVKPILSIDDFWNVVQLSYIPDEYCPAFKFVNCVCLSVRGWVPCMFSIFEFMKYLSYLARCCPSCALSFTDQQHKHHHAPPPVPPHPHLGKMDFFAAPATLHDTASILLDATTIILACTQKSVHWHSLQFSNECLFVVTLCWTKWLFQAWNFHVVTQKRWSCQVLNWGVPKVVGRPWDLNQSFIPASTCALQWLTWSFLWSCRYFLSALAWALASLCTWSSYCTLQLCSNSWSSRAWRHSALYTLFACCCSILAWCARCFSAFAWTLIACCTACICCALAFAAAYMGNISNVGCEVWISVTKRISASYRQESFHQIKTWVQNCHTHEIQPQGTKGLHTTSQMTCIRNTMVGGFT